MFRRAKGADAGERLLRRDTRQRGDGSPDASAADPSGGAADPTRQESEVMLTQKRSRRRRRGDDTEETAGPGTTGPYDVEDVDEADEGRLDLGSLRLAMREEMELQVQVQENSDEVVAVLALWPESAVELRAFAAPKLSGMWDDIRPEIAADTVKNGGTAQEADGSFGTELRMKVRVEDGGRQMTQPQRLWGIDGPRWFLRANVVGRAAVDDDQAQQVEEFVRDIVVVRGREAMAPREALPLTMPDVQTPDGVEEEKG